MEFEVSEEGKLFLLDNLMAITVQSLYNTIFGVHRFGPCYK